MSQAEKQCAGKTKKGARCKRKPQAGSAFCYKHEDGQRQASSRVYARARALNRAAADHYGIHGLGDVPAAMLRMIQDIHPEHFDKTSEYHRSVGVYLRIMQDAMRALGEVGEPVRVVHEVAELPQPKGPRPGNGE